MNLSRDFLFQRQAELDRSPVHFFLDGKPVAGLQGDTVLTAVLTQTKRLRSTEFSGQPRAGFCLMGSCQDCWIGKEEGGKIQACATLLQAGMCLQTLVEIPRGACA